MTSIIELFDRKLCSNGSPLITAVAVMNKKTDVQHNRIHHLEDTMIMYGVYNSDTLTDLTDTVHRMQNFTSWNEKNFAGKLHDWMEIYSQDEGMCNYASDNNTCI